MMINRRVIQPYFMEESFMRSHKPCIHIYQRSLREFFIKVHGRILPNLMKQVYSNLMIVGTSLKSTIKGVEINIHRDDFGKMFEFPIQGASYTYESPKKSLKSLSTLFLYTPLLWIPWRKGNFLLRWAS